MSESLNYLPLILGIAGVFAGVVTAIAFRSAKKEGKKLDAIRKERADIERQLRNLKPHLQQ